MSDKTVLERLHELERLQQHDVNAAHKYEQAHAADIAKAREVIESLRAHENERRAQELADLRRRNPIAAAAVVAARMGLGTRRSR